MDFTMNVMDNTRGITASQTTVGSVAAYQAHQATAAHQAAHQSQLHQVAVASHQAQQQQQQQRNTIHEATATLVSEAKLQELTKDDSEGAFTPPPRVASVGSISHQDARAEKGTDTAADFEPAIKVEIRGVMPGLNVGSEKDKNSVIQLHFNSPNEVLHYFSQRTVPQIDAFNLLTNPELVRNINPDLVRNHFLYVPSTQDTARVSSNGYSGSSSAVQATPAQISGQSSIIVTNNNLGGVKPIPIKQERRRGEVPPGTIIHRNVPLEPLPNQYVCWICGLDLQKSLPFEEHMVDQHNVEKPYKCEDCGVTFKRKAHLDRHRRIHLPTRPYQCGVCGKGFTRNEHVRRHAFTHSGEKPFSCPTCGKTFSRREHLTKHLLSHTKVGQHSPTPSIAHQTGEYEEYMYSSPVESPNNIEQQQVLFQTAEGQTINAQTHHSGLLHFQQFNQQSSSSTASTANAVGLNMSKQQRQNIQQGLANTLFLQATDHQNSRIVTINQTGTTVPVPNNIVSPAASHTFHATSSSASAGHSSSGGTRNHNGEPVARPYQCGVCGKAFIRNEHLRRHVLTHSGEKPHVCAQCSKAFSRREHLTKHIRSHNKSVIGSVGGTPSSASILAAATTASSSGTVVVSHSGSGIHVTTTGGAAGSQVGSQAIVSSGLPPSGVPPTVVSASNQPSHSGAVVHSMSSSHTTPVAHPTHITAGPHYLPMFSLLAEVV